MGFGWFGRAGLALVAGWVLANSVGCADEIDRAAQRGELEKVRGILDTHPDLVNAKGHHAATPLHLAALCGRTQVVELLLERHAEVDARDSSGWTAMHYAATQGQGAIAEMLIAHHADVNAKDNLGRTPLYWAKAGLHQEVAALLEAHGGR